MDTNIKMGQLQRLTDEIWTIEVLVDENGHLNIWLSAYDGDTPMEICDETDMSDNESSWASRFYYRKDN